MHAVVQNLRVAVLLNPAHPDFTARLECNPALLCSTQVHWMEALSESQAAGVAQAGVSEACGDAADVAQLTQQLVAIHAAAGGHVAVTPQHFKALVTQTASVLAERRQSIAAQVDFLQVRVLIPCTVALVEFGHQYIPKYAQQCNDFWSCAWVALRTLLCSVLPNTALPQLRPCLPLVGIALAEGSAHVGLPKAVQYSAAMAGQVSPQAGSKYLDQAIAQVSQETPSGVCKEYDVGCLTFVSTQWRSTDLDESVPAGRPRQAGRG